MKNLIAVLILSLGFQAQADLGVGGVVSFAQDTWDASGPGLQSTKADGMTTRFGILGWFPLFPTLSLRGGVFQETQKLTAEYSVVGKSDTKLTNTLIPLNLQFSLPVTDLYIFGGAVIVSNNKVEPSGEINSDTRMNAGVGYSFVDLGLAKLNVELEYQKGTNNISKASGFDLKNQSIALNIGAQFGL